MFGREREKFKSDENKLLIAKVIDKYKFSKTKNKITYTDFLTISEISIIKKFLKQENIKNYIFFGGRKDADRNVLIFYPEKIIDNTTDIIQKNYKNIFQVIRIKLPNNIKYEHREFLSGIMKIGIKREKFGDIIVTEYGADIIVLTEISKILMDNLKNLTRFKKAEITLENIENLTIVENQFEELNIIVNSIRLDAFVSGLARCSRSGAEELIKQGKVLLNSINEFKSSKKININDIITIRGKGKFIFEEIEKQTKSGKFLLKIKKYK